MGGGDSGFWWLGSEAEGGLPKGCAGVNIPVSTNGKRAWASYRLA